jgi:Trk-type K+ transport system membrane component
MATPPSIKLILGLCIGGAVGWFLLFGLSAVGAWDALLVLVPFVLIGAPILLLGLAYALVRAVHDLIRHPEVRTLANIVVTVSGVIFLVVAAIAWFSSASQHNAAL